MKLFFWAKRTPSPTMILHYDNPPTAQEKTTNPTLQKTRSETQQTQKMLIAQIKINVFRQSNNVLNFELEIKENDQTRTKCKSNFSLFEGGNDKKQIMHDPIYKNSCFFEKNKDIRKQTLESTFLGKKLNEKSTREKIKSFNLLHQSFEAKNKDCNLENLLKSNKKNCVVNPIQFLRKREDFASVNKEKINPQKNIKITTSVGLALEKSKDMQIYTKKNKNLVLNPFKIESNQSLKINKELQDYLRNKPNPKQEINRTIINFNQCILNTPTQEKRSKLYFQNLKKLLFKFFLDDPIKSPDQAYSLNEEKIFQAILSKKRIDFASHKKYTEAYLSKLNTKFFKKKRETYLKFTFPKCVKHLKKILETSLTQIFEDSFIIRKISRKDLEHFFYKHYFANIAKKEGIPIERFYIFKNHTHRFSSNIPKSVNLDMINLWKQNQGLVKQMVDYLKGSFMKDVSGFNKLKIEGLLDKWGRLVDAIGEEKAVDKIVDGIKNRHSKLPWTLCEIRYAVKKTIDLLIE